MFVDKLCFFSACFLFVQSGGEVLDDDIEDDEEDANEVGVDDDAGSDFDPNEK